MTKYPSSLRPGLTAIAAVLVLSATPAFAQTTEAAPQAAPELTIAPPAPSTAPAATPLTSTPLASTPSAPTETTANMSAPVEAAPAAPVATRSPLVVHEAPASGSATPAAPRAATARVASKAPATAAPASIAPALAAPAPIAQKAEPASAPPTAEPAATVAATRTTQVRTDNDIGLIAGAGALGLIVLGGGAFALGRRKRHDAETLDYAPYEPEAEVVAEPAYVAPAAIVAAPSVAAQSALAEGAVPEGFDLSRYGPHTRAAYAGPTADNPFLSLRKRLKRASFYDQRLRESGQVDDAAQPVAKQQEDRSQTIVGKRLSDRLNFRPAARGSRVTFKPATA